MKKAALSGPHHWKKVSDILPKSCCQISYSIHLTFKYRHLNFLIRCMGKTTFVHLKFALEKFTEAIES